MDATTVAVDLAKDVFEVALANRAHRIIDRKRLTRRQFESFIESLGVRPSNRCDSHVASCGALTIPVTALGDGRIGAPCPIESHGRLTRRGDTA